MPPTVYIADITCDSGSDSETSDQGGDRPTYILGFGVNDLRLRRRSHMIHRRDTLRARHPLMGRSAETSYYPMLRSDEARMTPNSIDGNNHHCHPSSISLHNLKSSDSNLKSWSRSSRCHRLLLLRKREGLLDITIRTVALIQRNQLLQMRLAALQAETRAFVKSVMNNPENQGAKLQQATPKVGGHKTEEDSISRDTQESAPADCDSTAN